MSHALPTQPHYALGCHVFLCVCGQDVVLLDLAKDKYLALEAPRTAGLSTFVRGWPAPARVAKPMTTPQDCASMLESLLHRGLLTVEPATGKDATPTAASELSDEINADGLGKPARVNPLQIALIATSYLTGRYLRRHRSIEQIVARVRHRKERAGFVAKEFDLERARQIIAAYGAMRALFFSTRNLCLLEATVLLELFARYALYPDWVFGVHVRPFAAHCWLQHDGIVLNDTIDNVGRYTPIMVV